MKPVFSKSTVALLVASAAALATSGAFAHVTYFQKDAYTTKDGRSYLEGTSAALSINLSHACTRTTGTQISTSVFPLGSDAEVYDLTLDPMTNAVMTDPVLSATVLSDVLTADAISGIKPEVDGDWGAIVPKLDEAAKVRAIHWHHGWTPDNYFERLTYRVSFARFKPESCYSKVRVYIPASQFCSETPDGPIVASHWWAWAGIPEAGVTANPIPAGFSKAVGYASFVDLDRDLENNPLPMSCGQDHRNKHYDVHNDHNNKTRPGMVLGIYPSVDTMRRFGPHTAGGITNPADCPPGTTLQHDMTTMTNICVPTAP